MLRKQILLLGNKKMFLPQVKNIFASLTQILRPQHMFPSLATMKAMLTSFQCCSLKMLRSPGDENMQNSSPDFFGSQFIIMRMRNPLFSETMFPRLATGAAKHFVCFPLV